MSKNTNKRSKAARQAEPMTGTMKFFLAGCVAELYLLVVQRFYIRADSDLQRIAWYDQYLWILLALGLAALAAGVVCSYLWRADRKKRIIGWSLAGGGIYVALVAGLVRWNMSTMTLLMVMVPVVILLGVLWSLYDRECSLSLTVLGAALIMVWVCRRVLSSVFLSGYVKVAAVLYLALVIVLLFLLGQGKLGKIFPAKADPLPVYVSCVLSFLAVATALVSLTAAYYAMWCLAAVIFGLGVYYTVKQL